MENKPIDTTRKGNRAQLKARRKLEAEGWQCYVARRGYKGQQIDIWGLWDIIAYRDGYVLLVQVKSNRCRKEDREALERFLTDGVFVKRELWIYKDYSKFNPFVTELHGEPEEGS